MCGSWSVTENFLSFWPFFALLPSWQPKKSKFWKNEKNPWRYYYFTLVQNKWPSYDVWFLRYQVQQTELLVILDHFLPFYSPSNPKNQNFEKLKKTPGGIIIVYHKWQSFDVWFLRYWAWWTEFFVIFDHLLPFYPPYQPEKPKFWKTEENKISSFYTSVPKIMIICYTVP